MINLPLFVQNTQLTTTSTLQTEKVVRNLVNPVELREIQKKAKLDLYAEIKAGFKRIQVVAPCAFGKTRLATSIIYDAVHIKGKRALFVVPFTVLIAQTLDTFAQFGMTAGVIAGGYRENRYEPIQIATIQTLAMGRDIAWFNADVILLDECHTSAWSSWSIKEFPLLKEGARCTGIENLEKELKALEYDLELCKQFNRLPSWDEIKHHYKKMALKYHPDHNPENLEEAKIKMQSINNNYEIIKKYKHLLDSQVDLKIEDNRILIGLTATPYRLSKRESMGDIFETQVLCPTPNEMINLGLLTPLVIYTIKGANLKGVKTRQGDFDLGELEVRCADDEVIQSAVENYQKLGQNKLFIAFACTVNHANKLHDKFQEVGINTALVTAETSTKERNKIYGDLQAGIVRGLVNVNCCSTGFDVTEIECLLLCRPTKSKALHIQMVGRGMRLAPHISKTECIVLDQAANTKRFGFIEDLKYPSLRESPDIEKGEVPTKECPKCHATIRVFEKICPHCGHEFVNETDNKIRPIGDLALTIRKQDKPIFEHYRKMLRYSYSSNKHPGYAAHQTKQVYKLEKFPPTSWALHAVFGQNYTEFQMELYKKYLLKIAHRDNLDEPFVKKFFKMEFGNWKEN